jgi:pimeloyl-ACP methyl ester carboxylesterase
MKSWLLSAVGALVVGFLSPLTASAKSAITMEEFMVPTADAGIQIYVRNKHPADMSRFRPERTVLFVHGATYPSETAFDLQLDGQSWMDYIAARGFDVYLLDLRGYGKSTRPSEMDKPAADNKPIVRGDTGVKDVGTAVDFILQRRNIKKLNLLGWSWGTVLMATYATQNPAKVERLTLYAPVWIRQTPSLVQASGAYRVVTREQAFGRWMTGVPEDKKATLIPKGWFDKWADATFATDAWGQQQSPPVLRAPNGVVQDGQEYWSARKAYWDPDKVTMPVMLIQAEWDQDTPPYMAQTLFPLLKNAPQKRYVQLGEGTHTIIMEKNRMQLFRAVQAFLEESARS